MSGYVWGLEKREAREWGSRGRKSILRLEAMRGTLQAMKQPAELTILEYRAPAHVDLKLGWIDPYTVSFDLWVEPAYRNQGLATRALETLSALLKKHGAECVVRAEGEECGPSDQKLRSWYERHGYRVVE